MFVIFQDTGNAGRRLPPMPTPAFVGRNTEGAKLERLLESARIGRSEVLVLRGERGIGKTALLDHAALCVDGFRVIRVRGIESEMELPFAGLHLLCSAMGDCMR